MLCEFDVFGQVVDTNGAVLQLFIESTRGCGEIDCRKKDNWPLRPKDGGKVQYQGDQTRAWSIVDDHCDVLLDA